MEQRITKIKQKQSNEMFSDWIPIGATASNIEVQVDTSISEDGVSDLQSLIDNGQIGGGGTDWIFI